MSTNVLCDPSGIPQEIREYQNWMVWKLEDVEGKSKPAKIPYSCHTLERARHNEPTEWTDFNHAVEVFESSAGLQFDGLGFAFSKDAPFVGFDIDGCLDEHGKIKQEFKRYVDLMDTYTEVSQSGTGVKGIAKGKKQGSKCRNGNVELYGDGRFFALTGCRLAEFPATVEERQNEVEQLERLLLPLCLKKY